MANGRLHVPKHLLLLSLRSLIAEQFCRVSVERHSASQLVLCSLDVPLIASLAKPESQLMRLELSGLQKSNCGG